MVAFLENTLREKVIISWENFDPSIIKIHQPFPRQSFVLHSTYVELQYIL